LKHTLNHKVVFTIVLLGIVLCAKNIFAQDTVASISHISDTTEKAVEDSVKQKKPKPLLTSRIDYKASDSIAFDFDSKEVFIYNNGKLNFETNQLDAGFIKMNLDSNMMYATYFTDTSGNPVQYPVFRDAGKDYQSHELTYNFNTKKGIIQGVFTKEGEGFLHGEKIKKVDDKTMFIRGGLFTTCDEPEHPHFAINFSKGKAVSGDKIVTGPAWFSIMEIPLPVGLPFGYFPFTDKQKSGLLIPTYGYADNRGYYFRNIGWYFAFNDYFDLALQGDIYTNLSYALNARTNYVKRYRYNGRIEFRFEENHSGFRDIPSEAPHSYGSESNFKFNWSHTQDAKAHPYRTFSANVNLVSRSYSKNTINLNDRFTNTTTSSIAFSTRFGSKLSFTANLGESYNINTGSISLDLPSITLSSSQIYPFRIKKNKKNIPKWLEEISVSYRMNLINKVEGIDTVLFSANTFSSISNVLSQMRNGIQHSIPLQSNIKFLKHFNWSNSVSYTERWYLSSVSKTYDVIADSVFIDTSYGFTSNRDVRFTSSINTKIYGMFNFKKGIIVALRHVLDPSISFNFTPNFATPSLKFYGSYTDKQGKIIIYSKTENGIFGSPPNRMSGVVNFSLNNNLEMKTKSKSDTVTGTKKYVLLESFNISTGYDMAADSCNWQPLNLTARTTLFERLRVEFNASYTPYVIDSNGRLQNKFLWDTEGKLFRRNNSTWNFNMSWQLNSKKAEKEKEKEEESSLSTNETLYSPFANPNIMFGQHVDFDIPWSLSISASASRISSFQASLLDYQNTNTLILNIRGDINITSKWKIGLSSGYDFINKEFTNTSIDFYRDLHCWEMRLNWTPFGVWRGWNFTISVKASMLQDLKYEKRNDFRNRLEY
jgi:lipopolysaccharide assembly outer membrane protein LptD (OstA)